MGWNRTHRARPSTFLVTNEISAFFLDTFYKTVKNNEKHGLIFKDLNEEERENVVAVVIGYEDAENFKVNILLNYIAL